MISKEKAKAVELVGKHFLIDRNSQNEFTIKKTQAKQCALITVNEIINNIIDDDEQILNYWVEVKQEIEKL